MSPDQTVIFSPHGIPASFFDDGSQGRGVEDFSRKPFLSEEVTLRAKQDVEVLQSGKAVEQKSQDHLAEEPISPG